MSNTPHVDILFGPYEPDYGGLPRQEAPGYLVDAINVRLTPNGWRGQPTFANVTAATAIGATNVNRSNSAAYYRNTSFNVAFFTALSSGKLWESRDEGVDTWLDVSPSGTALNELGEFARFSNDVIYACSSRAPVKKTLTDTHATVFTDLAGSPPAAANVARVRQHLVLSGLADPFAIRTSAIGDHEDWPTPGTTDARSKQSIYEELDPGHGAVVRVLWGEKFGIVMQQNALTRMTYVGGSAVYEFDTYERIEGGGAVPDFYTLRPVSDGERWYWYNTNGFFVTDGYSVRNLSEGKLDEALFTNSIAHPNGTSLKISRSAVYDARRKQVIFGAHEYTGQAKYQLVYNTVADSFSLINETNEMGVFSGFCDSTTTAAITGLQVYNINGSDRKLQRFTGATGTIAMQTGYIEIDPGYNVQLQSAHLLGTGTGSLTLAYKTAATSADCDVSQSGFTSLTAAGLGQKKTGRATAQYIAFRVTGTGAESQLIRGIRVYFNRAQPAT